jgi:single-stranded-DNA-specific exonuclease
MEVRSVRVVGRNPLPGKPGHLKLVLSSPQGGRPFDAIGFGMAHLPVTPGTWLDILYTPVVNVWNGHESMQLRLRDIKMQ